MPDIILTSLYIPDKIRIVLVEGVVSKVHVGVIDVHFIWVLIFDSGKSRKAFFENKNP